MNRNIHRRYYHKERKSVTIEDLTLSSSYPFTGMINVLRYKGIMTGKEVLDEMEVIVATKGEERVYSDGIDLQFYNNQKLRSLYIYRQILLFQGGLFK